MVEPRPVPMGPEYPYADSPAARMLKSGIQGQKANGVSLRTIAKKLEYRQATVLSHMANGRVGIPIERAADIARAVGLDEREFLNAVLAQRKPKARALFQSQEEEVFGLASELRVIADKPLDNLTDDQKAVIREAVSDPQPGRRWLTLAELATVALLRRLRPGFRSTGLGADDLKAIEESLSRHH
jgi:hypothetical protein